jgi:predicted site-specific integrase-resolvase
VKRREEEIMANCSLNATEKSITENGKEVPQTMPAYVRNGKVYRLPDEKNGVKIYVEEPVYNIASRERKDLQIAE